MKPQQFALLAIAAAISLSAALAVYQASAPWSGDAGGGAKLFPGLDSALIKVSQIELSRGDEKLTLKQARDKQTGDTWLMADRDGFPASAEKIRPFLTSLAGAVLVEAKTRLADRYPILNLEDPSDKNANSRLVRLLDGEGGVVAEAVVGKLRAEVTGGGAGTYVRRPGDEQTWLADTDIAGGPSLRDWTQPRLFETPSDKVTKLRIEVAGEPAYEIDREDAGTHKLAEIPDGKKLRYVNLIDTIVDAASFIEFADVRKATGAAGGEAGTASLETDNGLKVTLKLRREKDAAWLTLSATGEGEGKTLADRLMERAANWEFKVLPSKIDGILKKRDDLLEDSAS